MFPTVRFVVLAVTNDPYVVDENANDCSAVHELALPRFRDRVEAEPPRSAPNVPDTDRDPLVASDDVAAVCSEPVPPTVYRTPLADRFDRFVMF
jgi:hypothetical protein